MLGSMLICPAAGGKHTSRMLSSMMSHISAPPGSYRDRLSIAVTAAMAESAELFVAGADEYPCITCSGSAFDMGLQHGAQARKLIREYLRFIIDSNPTKSREKLLQEALDFVPSITALSPEYIEETKGLAAGATNALAIAALLKHNTRTG
eukprot:SAG31_NODE_16777_length_696_cov_1.209380_1_plen_149_part_01